MSVMDRKIVVINAKNFRDISKCLCASGINSTNQWYMRYIFGNWKMYLNEEESVRLAREIGELSVAPGFSCAVFPNTLSFLPVRDVLRNSSFSVGAQNVSWVPRGAYTGATSAELFCESGAAYALVGHSERRYIFGEDDSAVRKKIEACIDVGLVPVVCVGEEKHDRDNGKAEYRVKKQLMKVFEGLSIGTQSVIVAYEPIWAIGTGDACSDTEAARMIGVIKEYVAPYHSGEIPVLYGGSVDAQNVHTYLSHGIIDGVLIGKASTDVTIFEKIVTEHT